MADPMVTEGDYDCVTCGEPLNIVGMVEHDCEEILSVGMLRRSEQATLMHVETRVVDYEGVLDWEKMNYEDQQNLTLFTAVGLLETGGRQQSDQDASSVTQQVVTFTDRAFDLARDCRQARAQRMIDHDLNTPEDDDGD